VLFKGLTHQWDDRVIHKASDGFLHHALFVAQFRADVKEIEWIKF
jgi:hypothetical protein